MAADVSRYEPGEILWEGKLSLELPDEIGEE